MATSYASWSLADLEKEKARIEKAISTRSNREKKQVRAKLEAMAKRHGMTLSDMQDLITPNGSAPKRRATKKKASKAKGKKVAPKYRSKSDPELTWTGRGRTPLWVVEFEKKGGKRDQLLIK